MPATFNAAEYETTKILGQIGAVEYKLQLLEDISLKLENLERNQSEITMITESLQDNRLPFEEIQRQLKALEDIPKKLQEIADFPAISKVYEDMQQQTQLLRNENEKLNQELGLYREREKRLTPQKSLQLELHIAEQCNLNCKGCSHFSCIAEPELLDPVDFESDIARLSELFENGIEQIKLLGGEPLLNPKIGEICSIARRYFPDCNLVILTNGTLLPKMESPFWKTCKQEKVIVQCTEYPIQFNYQLVRELAEYHGVPYESVTYELDAEGEKTFHHLPLDLNGKQNPFFSFRDCFEANSGCITLYHGRIFTCTVAANARHFKKYFNSDIVLSSLDSIDIYQAKDAQEILDFLARPIPFCRYCDIKGRTFGHAWGTTKRDIHEWTLPYPEGK